MKKLQIFWAPLKGASGGKFPHQSSGFKPAYVIEIVRRERFSWALNELVQKRHKKIDILPFLHHNDLECHRRH